MKKTYGAGLGVVVLMSAKGTATLAATFLLPTWPARIFALVVVLALAGFERLQLAQQVFDVFRGEVRRVRLLGDAVDAVADGAHAVGHLLAGGGVGGRRRARREGGSDERRRCN